MRYLLFNDDPKSELDLARFLFVALSVTSLLRATSALC